jgi:hypothetical protein
MPPAVEVAVGAVPGVPPPPRVTSGLAVTLAAGFGASTHLATLSPLALAVVVQKEPCARTPGASTRTETRDTEADTTSFLTGSPLPEPLVVGVHNLNETGARINTGGLRGLSPDGTTGDRSG